MLLPIAKSLFRSVPLTTYVDIPRVIHTYGYLPILFSLLGTFLLAIRGGKKNYGLMGMKRLGLPEKISIRLRAPLITQNVGKLLCLVFIGLTLAMCIPDRQDTPYYHMIDRQDYEAFVWIKDNVNGGYEKAILDPWKATAFTAITGKKVYTRIHAYPKPSDMEAYAFLRGGCTDTAFLREDGISVVYTRGSCRNPNLVEVRENVYVLKEAQTQ